MKWLQRAGLGSKKRKAELLTAEEEELLWTKGLLGSGSCLTQWLSRMAFTLLCAVEASIGNLDLILEVIIEKKENAPTLSTQKMSQRIDLEASKVEN